MIAPRPIQIATLVGTFPVVSETFIVNQITGLLDAGHRVDIYAWSSGNGGPVHQDVLQYKLVERTRYIGPPASYLTRLAKAPALLAGSQAQRTPRATLNALNPLRHGRLAMSLNLLYGSAGLRQNGAHYDILHCQFGTLARMAAALRDTGVTRGKLVVSFRGADLTKGVRKDDYAGVLDKCDLVLPVCDAFRQRLVAFGADAAKIHVHRSGIRVRRFAYVERCHPRDQPIRILTIARLVEKKGVAYAVEAIARLKAAGRRVRYSIVGDGTLRRDLEALVDRLRLHDVVEFLGPRSQEEVVTLIDQSHVLLVPSVTASDGEQEGIPNVLKEGMASGLPVVSTLHSGIPELVEDGRSGLLVAERDAEALADRLGWLMDHPESWAAMARAGRARVEAEYDSDMLNGRLAGLFERLLSQETR